MMPEIRRNRWPIDYLFHRADKSMMRLVLLYHAILTNFLFRLPVAISRFVIFSSAIFSNTLLGRMNRAVTARQLKLGIIIIDDDDIIILYLDFRECSYEICQ